METTPPLCDRFIFIFILELWMWTTRAAVRSPTETPLHTHTHTHTHVIVLSLSSSCTSIPPYTHTHSKKKEITITKPTKAPPSSLPITTTGRHPSSSRPETILFYSILFYSLSSSLAHPIHPSIHDPSFALRVASPGRLLMARRFGGRGRHECAGARALPQRTMNHCCCLTVFGFCQALERAAGRARLGVSERTDGRTTSFGSQS